jgi:hypothetical protein
VEYWKKWMAQVFQGQVLAQKWRKHHWDAQVGNVVLVKNETTAGEEFQRERVMEAIPREDGHVRSVQVEFKNPGEKVFRSTLRPIQKIAVIVPLTTDLKTIGPVVRKLETEAAQEKLSLSVLNCSNYYFVL